MEPTEIKIKAADLPLKEGIKIASGKEYIFRIENTSGKTVYFVEFEDMLFRNDSAFMMPEWKRAEDVISGIDLVISTLLYAKDNSDKTILVAGHADTTGSADYNVTLSWYRARAVLGMITGGRDMFSEAADGAHMSSSAKKSEVLHDDRVQVLNWAADVFGWPCNITKERDYFTAVRQFQQNYNSHAGEICSNPLNLAVDGDFGIMTCGACFDCYQYQVSKLMGISQKELQQRQAALRLFDKEPDATVKCGESHPIDEPSRDNYRSSSNRRIEVLFFDENEKPDLPCVTAECSADNCPLYDNPQFGRVPIPLAKMKRQVVSVTWFFAAENIPYRKNAEHFKRGIYSIFGDDIPQDAVDSLLADTTAGSIPQPQFSFEDQMPPSAYGYYSDEKITLSRSLVEDALNDVGKRWLLLEVMLEEYGHHLDYLLRNHYSSTGGDKKGDEGYHFASDFIHFNKIVEKDVTYANFRFSVPPTKEIYSVTLSDLSREERCKQLLKIDKPEDDHGFIHQKDGAVLDVEFFAIRGAGAVHELITKTAADAAGVTYDYRLDEGCAWPDVPCEDQDSVETCYYNAWRNIHKSGTLPNRSHYGDLQFWHSMCPAGTHTNNEVRNMIINQLKTWFEHAHNLGFFAGLFHIGKAMHTMQDSYSRSHCYRDETSGSPGKILYFQGYDKQDSEKHKKADLVTSPGIKEALAASTALLKFHKSNTIYEPTVREFLEKVYELAPGAGEKSAGATHPDYAK
jgi:hypothetical protein